ncbi:hypothetical protein BDZ45DRAFT_725709 [Acephala macrosclerotiorum]|nr:hypothetical protein BDZ45DRAFT_725709 [Acephala macrosclerotiorum]
MAKVMKLLEEIDADHIIPRVGDEVPGPFEGGPIPAVVSWNVFFAIFADYLQTMVEECEEDYVTTSTLPTMMAAFLYQIVIRTHPPSSSSLTILLVFASNISMSNPPSPLTHLPDLSALKAATRRTQETKEYQLLANPLLLDDEGSLVAQAAAAAVDLDRNVFEDLTNELSSNYIATMAEVHNSTPSHRPPRPAISPSFFGAQSLTNIGQTCFLSSALQTLHHIPSFTVTGRSLSEFASRQMKKEELSLPLDHCRLSLNAISDLFKTIDVAIGRIDGDYIGNILRSLQTMGSGVVNDKNDPAVVLHLLLNMLFLASDSSLPGIPNQRQSIQLDQADALWARNVEAPVPIDMDATRRRNAFRAEGMNPYYRRLSLPRLLLRPHAFLSLVENPSFEKYLDSGGPGAKFKFNPYHPRRRQWFTRLSHALHVLIFYIPRLGSLYASVDIRNVLCSQALDLSGRVDSVSMPSLATSPPILLHNMPHTN